MNGLAARLKVPYRPLPVGRVALTIALISVGTSFTLWAGLDGPFDLRDVILRARQTIPSFALPLGWLGVWAARLHRPESAVIGPAPGRPRSQIVHWQSGLLMGSVSVGWILGWSVAGGIALGSQYWAPVELVAMATLAVAVGSLAVIGLSVAMLSGTRSGAFLAPLALLAVILIPSFWLNDTVLTGLPVSTQALSYVWSVSVPIRGTELVLETEVVRLAFYALVAVAVSMAAAGWAEFRSTRRRSGLASSAWLVFPLSTSIVISLMMPILDLPEARDQVVCEVDAGFNLCIYQIDESRRRDFEAMLTPLIRLLPEDVATGVTITQDWEQAEQVSQVGIGRLGGDRADWFGNEARSVVVSLFLPASPSAERCSGKPERVLTETSGLEGTLLRQVTRRAAAGTDDRELSMQFAALFDDYYTVQAADEAMDELSDSEFRSWFERERGRLADCSISAKDFR